MAEITNWRTDTYASGDTMPPSQAMDMRDQILKNSYDYWVFDYSNALNSLTTKPTKAVTGTNFKVGTLAFQDAALPVETFQPQYVPPWFDSSADITIYLFWYSTVTTGNIIWGHYIYGGSASEAIDPVITITDWTAETTPAVASTIKVSSKTLTAGTHALLPNDLLYFAIRRNGTHASDTLASSAYLISAIITWAKGI